MTTLPSRGSSSWIAAVLFADIRYPTDLSLLNESREKLEHVIDVLHDPLKGKEKKPRTYRRNARKDFLKVAKKKRSTKKEIRKVDFPRFDRHPELLVEVHFPEVL